jgi:hypothetical protein
MDGKRKKLTTSLLLEVSLNCTAFGVKSSDFSDCPNLSAQNYSSPVDAQKLITLRPFIVTGHVNKRLKTEKLVYIFYV